MLWRERFRHRWLSPVTGFLIALLLWQGVLQNVLPNVFLPLFQIAYAASATLQPDGDGTVVGSQTTCGGAGNYDCLNDGVATSSNPGTAGDYLTYNYDQADFFTVTTASGVDTVNTVYVPVYHVESGNNMSMTVSLWDAAEGTQYGTTQSIGYNSVTGWDTATFSSLGLTQTQLDGMKVRLQCLRSGGKPNNCTAYAMYAVANYSEAINVTVSATGTQQDLKIGTTSAHVGGRFAITENTSSRSITSIKITEQGTVDAAAHLKNIKLRYEYDTSSPYTCDDVSYNGTEAQFGSTDADGFSAANGISTFTGSASITTSQAMCVYVVLDVNAGATPDQTIELEIDVPTTDVVGSGSPIISPATSVLLASTTILRKAILKQENYHWRDDSGNEGGAASVTGSENTTYDVFPKDTTRRLRLAVYNAGNTDSDPAQFRLEYAEKGLTCDTTTGWVDVGATADAFDMSFTGNITDGTDSTDISNSIGGVTNPDTNHLSPNGGLRSTNSQTGSLTLNSTQFVELEYSIIASTSITDGTTYCFRVTNAGTPITYTNYPQATIAADVLVDATSTQVSQVTIPSSNQYAGGAFRVTDTTFATGTISSVTITAGGTVDLQNDISNIKLKYDLDTTAPYTCDDVSYASGDTQFGSTASAFNGSNMATFSDSVENSPTQTVCFYVEYDVDSDATDGETLELYIENPSNDVVIAGSSVAPTAPVLLDGTTVFAAPHVEQYHFHWRNNNGNETGATSATGGSENTTLEDLTKGSTYRVRFAVANTGLADAPEARYQIEWAQRLTTCGEAIDWEPLDTASDEWEMSPTGNLTEGNDTTDVSLALGGVSNPAGFFLSDNNGVNDTTDTTASSTLPADNYLDLEYAVSPTTEAVQGATYCFRVTDNGTPLDNYVNYPKAIIKLDTDYKIQRGTVTMTGATVAITAGVDYEAPSSTANSFIRITNTQLTGAGPNTGNSTSNADDVTVYITNPTNLATSITFARAAAPAGNTRISWEIIEYTGPAGGENEIIVRRAENVSYGAANTTVSGTVTNTIANNNDVVVFITGQYNADAGRNAFHQGLSTAAWNSTNNQADFTRGAGGAVSTVSYALVEFTGSNWKVQRNSHTYTAAGAIETGSITAVNSLARTFLHVQKRTTSNNHADMGHEVWLSGIGQISYLIDPNASTPAGHTTVAWVIENIQTQGATVDVHRSNGSIATAGTGPVASNINIGVTIDDLTITSLFVNNRSDETQRSWPEPFLGATIISSTQYELWRSDTSANINYRTEVVEWPTAARKLTQNYFRIYEDNGLLTPTTPWPAEVGTLSEKGIMTSFDNPLANGETARIRMTLQVSAAAMPSGLDSFRLEYGLMETSCAAIGDLDWHEIGEVGSTTALWRGFNNTPADGTPLSTDPPTGGELLISVSDVAGTYEEQNDTSLNPYLALPGEDVEFDWVVQHNGAQDKSSYCFRMSLADHTPLDVYNPDSYPVLRTVGYEPTIKTWRWYDDETNETPTTPLANQNVAPIDIAHENIIKLRISVKEKSGAAGVNNKFAVQYSEQADFSSGVYTLTSTSTCLADSLWCYADGAGVDNELITTAVISDSDSCVAGTGNGCGPHNESTSTVTSTFDHVPYATSEFEFTLQHAGARTNAVYYFRLYDLTADEVVGLGATSTYPSLVTEGPQLVSTLSGVDAGTTIAGVTADATTTPTSIGFGSLPLGTSYEAIQQLAIDTNATEGYQMFVYASQQLTNTYGDIIPPVTNNNDDPDGWLTVCTTATTGCFGYHTTDATLSGPTGGRFGPIDSYAAIETTPREISYSSIPTNEAQYIIYRLLVREDQPAGDYQTSISYVSVPVF